MNDPRFIDPEFLRPFRITGPAKISFSGGRTSALMLWLVLAAHDGVLPDDVHVVFANTGKEKEKTLAFIHEIEQRWNVSVVWLERPDQRLKDVAKPFRVVDFYRAARTGEPFEKLIIERNFLPNPVTRFCTQELKIRVMKKWMLAQGYETWTNVIGLRHDEQKRVRNMRAGNGKDIWDVEMPLNEAGITSADVDAFWAAQPFDLGLKKWEGNCDACFLKGRAKRTRIMRDDPSVATWWIEMETTKFQPPKQRAKETKFVEHVDDPIAPMLPLGPDALRQVFLPKEIRGDMRGRFRYDAAPYADLLAISQQPMLDLGDPNEVAEDDIDDCVCDAA